MPIIGNTPAFSAEIHSNHAGSTDLRSIVRSSAEDDTGTPVFDLEVEDAHEFFANGVLVHNCTEGGGAFTAGVLVSKAEDGKIYVESVVRGQWGPATRETTIRQTTIVDMGRFPRNYRVYIEEEGGSSGPDANYLTIKNLPHGVIAKSVKPERNAAGKVGRARPFATQVGIGNVYLVAGPWNKEFIEELRYFPNSRYKDQVDAAAGAYIKLAKGRSSDSYDAA
jgi:predicted phage terminase large subunit-like protein